MFAADGKRAKYYRDMANIPLSPSKINGMINVIDNYSNILCEIIDRNDGEEPIDVHNLALRYTIDVACNVLMGIDENCLIENKSPMIEFAEITTTCSLMNVIKVCLRAGITAPGNLFASIIIDKSMNDYFLPFIRNIYDMRMKNEMTRQDAMNDFMNYLHDVKEDFNFHNLVGQMLIIVGGTFESTSSNITYALYELGNRKEYQDRLRQEIRDVSSKYDDGNLTIKSIREMKFLEDFLYEVLRIHPLLPALTRRCVKDYRVPDSDLIIVKGTSVLISTYGVHNDPSIFPNPERFAPERFRDNNNQKSPLIVFGAGQKRCPGKKLGLLIIKMAIAKIVQRYYITINDRTGKKLEPIGFSKHIVWKYKNTFWINFERIPSLDEH